MSRNQDSLGFGLVIKQKKQLEDVTLGSDSFIFLSPQVPNSFSPDLMISPVHLKDAGFYICRVNCGDAFEFSQWAQVDVLNVDLSCGTIQ